MPCTKVIEVEWRDELIHFEDEDTDGFDEAHFNGELFGSHLYNVNKKGGLPIQRSSTNDIYEGNSIIGNSFSSSSKAESSSSLSDSSYEGGSSRNLKKPQLNKKPSTTQLNKKPSTNKVSSSQKSKQNLKKQVSFDESSSESTIHLKRQQTNFAIQHSMA